MIGKQDVDLALILSAERCRDIADGDRDVRYVPEVDIRSLPQAIT